MMVVVKKVMKMIWRVWKAVCDGRYELLFCTDIYGSNQKLSVKFTSCGRLCFSSKQDAGAN